MTMNNYLNLAIIVIAAPVFLLLAHALASRIARAAGYGAGAPQKVAALTALAGNVPVALAAWAAVFSRLDGGWIEILCGFGYVLGTYNACCFCYLNAFNVTETSLHVNILMRIFTSNGMPLEELARIYGVQEMIAARVHRMIALGQLTESGGRYFLNNSSLVMVGRVINTWRRVLGLPLTPQ
jgi:hypothetical protein